MKSRLISCTALVLAGLSAGFAEKRPDWITGAEIAQLQRLGIDPDRDLIVRANYHWKWAARSAFQVGDFHCPAGTTISISRSLVHAAAPDGARCKTAAGRETDDVKIYPDGTATPLGD